MSEDKEIKFPSGSTIRFVGEDLNDVFKGLSDNPKLKASIEKYKNTDYGEEFESFDFFEKTEVQKLRSSKERKVWKLKRLNVKLGQKRSQFLNSFKLKGYTKPDGTFWITQSFRHFENVDVIYIANLSEQIGKNGNKIQRLRTLIQQEKENENKSNS